MVTVDPDEPVVKEETPVDEDVSFKIASQIEYYFADVNLRKDKFMKEELAKDDGWVPVDTLLTFNRMKSLTQDRGTVITALRTPHPNTDHGIEISEDETRIRRKVPYVELTEEQVAELNARTIHFKGITQDATLDEIRAFCSQYGKVISVEMRRMREDRKFKGCVMCVYSTKEEADKALAGTEVYDENIKFMRENKLTWQARKDTFNESRKNRKVKKEENGKAAAAAAAAAAVPEEENADPVRVKSTILLLEGVASGVKYETIKSFFKQHGSVAYVDTDHHQKRAYIRFTNENEAISVLKTATLKKEPKQEEKPADIVKQEEKKEETSGSEVKKVDESEEVAAPAASQVAQTDPVKEQPDDAEVKGEAVAAAATEPAVGENGGAADADVIFVEIDGSKYKASVLSGEEETSHWINLNKIRKQALSNPKGNDQRSGGGGGGGGRRGRGFKRGGKGYQGRNDRSDFKRKTRGDGDAGNKRIKAE